MVDIKDQELEVDPKAQEATLDEALEGVNDDTEKVDEVVENEQVEKENEDDSGLPKTADELNKLLQSASSKAKNELLKEIGLNKVSEIKELLDKGYKYADILKEAEELRGTNNNLKNEIIKRDNQKLIEQFNIPKESADLFIDLVDKQEGDADRFEKAKIVKEKLIGIVGGGVDKLGVEKTNEITNDLREEQIRKAMGLK